MAQTICHRADPCGMDDSASGSARATPDMYVLTPHLTVGVMEVRGDMLDGHRMRGGLQHGGDRRGRPGARRVAHAHLVAAHLEEGTGHVRSSFRRDVTLLTKGSGLNVVCGTLQRQTTLANQTFTRCRGHPEETAVRRLHLVPVKAALVPSV